MFIINKNIDIKYWNRVYLIFRQRSLEMKIDEISRKIAYDGTILGKARNLAEKYYDEKTLKQLDELADSVQENLAFNPPKLLLDEWKEKGLKVDEEKMKIQNEMAQTAAAVSYLHNIDLSIHDLMEISPKVARTVRQYQQKHSSLEADTVRIEVNKRQQLQAALLQQKALQR